MSHRSRVRAPQGVFAPQEVSAVKLTIFWKFLLAKRAVAHSSSDTQAAAWTRVLEITPNFRTKKRLGRQTPRPAAYVVFNLIKTISEEMRALANPWHFATCCPAIGCCVFVHLSGLSLEGCGEWGSNSRP